MYTVSLIKLQGTGAVEYYTLEWVHGPLLYSKGTWPASSCLLVQ